MTDSPSAIDDRADLNRGAPDDPDDQDAGGRTYVTAFSRGLRIISCFSAARPSLTIAEVAKAAGLNRATARRLLLTLEADGYASQRDGRYSLTPRVLDLGYSYLSSLPLDTLLYPSLFAVADRFRESCSAGVLDGHDVVWVARAQTSHPRVMTLVNRVGSRRPAYLTALGMVLLSGLPDDRLDEYLRTADLRKQTDKTITSPAQLLADILATRVNGWYLADEPVEYGVRAIAVPVATPDGNTLALSIASHVSAQVMMDSFLPALKQTATEIEHLLLLRN
ncbi:MAG TPA: IclR family transcriptional regulator C-terminal domain-containing protein [Trebonia sp.]|jgi:IclR family pca regulon transcriptional regulator